LAKKLVGREIGWAWSDALERGSGAGAGENPAASMAKRRLAANKSERRRGGALRRIASVRALPCGS